MFIRERAPCLLSSLASREFSDPVNRRNRPFRRAGEKTELDADILGMGDSSTLLVTARRWRELFKKWR